MTDPISKIESAICALKQVGFKFVGKTDMGCFKLRGHLLQSTADVCACEIELDPNFIELPKIRLLEIPAQLPSVLPHLGSEGYLCYIAKGSVVLDIFDPVGQSLACIKRAEDVLGQILKGEMIQDLEEEFYAYWGGGELCLVDMQEQNLGKQKTLVVKTRNGLMSVVTDDEARTSKKLKALGYNLAEYTILTYRIRTSAKPRPHTTSWPPNTVKDILTWQGLLDFRCRKKIEQRIQEGAATKANGALILIESPLLTYGFIVYYDRAKYQDGKSKLTRRRDVVYSLKVSPVSVIRIDDRYMAERNIPRCKTLAGNKIAIVGCGTIGGYLAEMLVKSGAGTSNGQLILIDSDILLPQNIGRHRLGFPNLFANKAVGLSEELSRLSPGASIRALPVDVMQAQLGKLDLLIDATGEESLGHWLCGRYLNATSMLSVWIEGPGTAVRALLHDTPDGACYRCLYEANKKGLFQTVVGSMPKIMAGHGCEGLYVPFPATVSVQAASLGAEMVMNWANSANFSSLQTRLTDNNFQLATENCNPSKQENCPVCNS
jgi:molybdopterin/thiamine biosynthesis adenylyltransferase